MTPEEATRNVAYETLLATACDFGFVGDHVKDLLRQAADGIVIEPAPWW